MPAGNFDGELHVHDGIVAAAGPFDKAVAAVTEMCVWVVQRDGDEDAIANNMGGPDMAMAGMPPHDKGKLEVFDLGTDKAHWTFPLTHLFKPVDFRNGSASAMATGVFGDKDGLQRSFYWSEPVRLIVHRRETSS